MTTKRQLARIVILAIFTTLVFFIGRELYYARSYVQMINPVSVSFDEMVQKAEVIARGVVTKKIGSYRTIENGEVMVYTRWQFNVDRVYKGNPGQTIKLKTAGGRYGLTEVQVEGAPKITPGKEVVIFISKQNGDYIFQFNQGYCDVTQDAQGGEILVQQLSKEVKTFDDLISAIK
ncbi:MAG: hypothetical protein PHH01_02090 [Patescibacteria group bacterium]|nr:hypothetical protein [Patescibacteria group bacterium]